MLGGVLEVDLLQKRNVFRVTAFSLEARKMYD
jgi:hypothetical protein